MNASRICQIANTMSRLVGRCHLSATALHPYYRVQCLDQCCLRTTKKAESNQGVNYTISTQTTKGYSYWCISTGQAPAYQHCNHSAMVSDKQSRVERRQLWGHLQGWQLTAALDQFQTYHRGRCSVASVNAVQITWCRVWLTPDSRQSRLYTLLLKTAIFKFKLFGKYAV